MREKWRAWAVTLRDSSSYHIVLEHAPARQLLQLVADGSAVFSVRGRNAASAGAARHETFNINMGSHSLELKVRFGSADGDMCTYELSALAPPDGPQSRGAKDVAAVKLVDGDGDMPRAGGSGSADDSTRSAGTAILTCVLVIALFFCCAIVALVLHVARSAIALRPAELQQHQWANDADFNSALTRAHVLMAQGGRNSSRWEVSDWDDEEDVNAEDGDSGGSPAFGAGGRHGSALAVSVVPLQRGEQAGQAPLSFGDEPRTLVHRAGTRSKEPAATPLVIPRHEEGRRLPRAERLRPLWVRQRKQLPPGTGARAAAELDAAAWWAMHPPPDAGAPAATPTSAAVRASSARLLAALGCSADLAALQRAQSEGAVLHHSAAWAAARNRTGSAMPPVVELYQGAAGEDAAGATSSQFVRITREAAPGSGGGREVLSCRLQTLLEQIRWAHGSGLDALTSALAGVAASDEAEAERAAEARRAAAGTNASAAGDAVGVQRVPGQLSALGVSDSFWGLVALDVLTRRSPLATGVHVGGQGTASTALASQRGSTAPPRNLHLCSEKATPQLVRELWEAPELFSVAIDGLPLDAARAALLARAVKQKLPSETVPLVPSAECAGHINRWRPSAPCLPAAGEGALTPAQVGGQLPCLVQPGASPPAAGARRLLSGQQEAPAAHSEQPNRRAATQQQQQQQQPPAATDGAPARIVRVFGQAERAERAERGHERAQQQHAPADKTGTGAAASSPATAHAAAGAKPPPLNAAEAADVTTQAYRLQLGRLALVELAAPGADAAELEALKPTLPAAVHTALLALSQRHGSAEVDVDEAARTLRALAQRAGGRCVRAVRHSARSDTSAGFERTLLGLHTCAGVRTVMHHFRGKGHKRRYVLFVEAQQSPPVHLLRDSDGGRIDFTRTGLTLKLLLGLKPHAALRESLVSQLVAMPLFEDMTTWNLYMTGATLVYIDQDSQRQTYDRWLPHATPLLSAVSSYRHTLELLAPEQCGPNPVDALVLSGPWTPLVGSCMRKPPRGAAAVAADAALPRCSNALAKPNVLCHDEQCRDTFVDCAAAYPWGLPEPD